MAFRGKSITFGSNSSADRCFRPSNEAREGASIAMQNVNIPSGDHDEVLLGEHRVFVEIWNEIVVEVDRDVLTQYHNETGIDAVEAFEILSYAHVAKAAYGLAGTAATGDEIAVFNPDEFGRRCASIAREQISRFRHKHTN